MVQKFQPAPNGEDVVTIQMSITADLPVEIANEVARLGIYQFDHCTYDEGTRRITATATTKLYRRGA